MIKIDSKGPIFFKQKRIGRFRKAFNILKFRTMKLETPKNIPTHMLKNPNAYITRVGNLLRKTSLDELPQLINVLKGDMSFIGPRPALWNQYDLIKERDKYEIHKLFPGISGYAQVNGRDALDIKKKVELDAKYVNKISFLFDIYIIFLTLIKVIKSEGIIEGDTGSPSKSKNNDLTL